MSHIMRVREIHRKVRTQFQSVAAQTLDNFLPEEIDQYVNRAVRQFVNQIRPNLRQKRINPRATEAQDKLRTLIKTKSFPGTTITTLSSVARAEKVDLSSTNGYEYFIAARLSAIGYDANCRLVTVPQFYDHAPSAENRPIFREPVVAEADSDLWILRPFHYEKDPEQLVLTYLQAPAKLSSVMRKKIDLIYDGSTEDPYIEVGGVPYSVPYNNSITRTINDFVDTQGPQIYQDSGLVVKREGDQIVINGFNSKYDTEDVNLGNVSNATLTLSVDSEKDTQNLDLPEDTHHAIVDRTVGLLKRDLPHAQSNKETPDTNQEEQS